MCFGGGGDGGRAAQETANQTAAQDRVAAEDARQTEIVNRAKQKRDDISKAIEGETVREGMRGGAGRRSLFRSSSGGAGFLNRFEQ